MNKHLGRQAVVIGAGIAGLAAARALADFFETVVVLERDAEPLEPVPRTGVPQGRHPHLLMGGGYLALSALLPGFGHELEAAGAIPFSDSRDIRREVPHVGVLPQRDFDILSFSMTRPVLERTLARRVAGHGNIEIRHGLRAIEILTDDADAVVGVRCERENGRLETLGAELAVDASGRAALTMACLQAHRREPPQESTIGVDIGYATTTVSIPRSAELDFVALVTMPEAPKSSRSGYMLRIGEEIWQVLLVGRDDERPPHEIETFLAFAETLPTPTIAEALKRARQPAEIMRFRVRESLWRHFGAGCDLPAGLLPIGDAICRFNPVYGQGMSVAAQEAKLLHEVLGEHVRSGRPLAAAVRDFLARAERLIRTPWSVSAVPDFLYPQTTGERPASLGEDLERLAGMFRRAKDEPQVHRALVEAHHLLQPHDAAESRSMELT